MRLFNNKYRNRIENKITELDKKANFLTIRLKMTSILLPHDRVKIIIERDTCIEYIKLLKSLL